jgi:predicted RNA-binding Zn-ribbon protein involved in translation (DUF1610 family)
MERREEMAMAEPIYPCPRCGSELYHEKGEEKGERGGFRGPVTSADNLLSDYRTRPVDEMCHCPNCGWSGTRLELINIKLNRAL